MLKILTLIMIIICIMSILCYKFKMLCDYYKLPFGAQLLIWTTRICLHGSCRTKPNKYDLINMAYNKVGIRDGSKILKSFLATLRKKENFHIQEICKRYLIDCEIDLIQCINAFKNRSLKKKYFINLWSLENEMEDFILYGSVLAREFKVACLNTEITINNECTLKNSNNNYNYKYIENFNTVH